MPMGRGFGPLFSSRGALLRCQWCSNPFGLASRPQLVVNPAKCTGCGRCVESCPQGVNTVAPGEKVGGGLFRLHRLRAPACPACPAGQGPSPVRPTLPVSCTRRRPRTAAFYRKGGGGVTLSGGEVLLQYEVAAETLRLCRTNYLNTCIETSAYAPWDHLWQVAQYCHTVFVDLKHMDSAQHQAMTGVGNEVILDNLTRLCRELPRRGGKVIVRMPLIPGYNDDDEAVAAGARFVAGLENAPELNLLPYHNLGESKYEMIGEDYPLPGLASRKGRDPRLLAIQALCQRLAPHNRVSLGGDAIDLT